MSNDLNASQPQMSEQQCDEQMNSVRRDTDFNAATLVETVENNTTACEAQLPENLDGSACKYQRDWEALPGE